jgi:hypothetical protein
MQKTLGILSLALVCVGCPPNVQQHAGFRRATIEPNAIQRPVGDLVTFEILPPVTRGTHWTLESHGLARFVGDDTGRIDWVADTRPIRMESVVAPWEPAQKRSSGGRGWLWFGMGDGAATEPLDVDLPVRPLPYREIAPVTYQSVFSLEPRDPRISFRKTEDRVLVTYRTPMDDGVPYAPRLGAMLLETGGRKILYAEVKTNFGERPKERIAFDVTFSYSASIADPVEVVVVEWVGHGLYYSSFDVHRMVVGSPAGNATAPAPSDTAPTPPTSAATAPGGAAAPPAATP